jgi:hypothetical protein
MERTYHLKNDLGLNKSTIKRLHEEAGRYDYASATEYPEQYKEAGELLNRRTQRYTKKEILKFIDYYITSHDDCVMDNLGLGEFSGIKEYQSQMKQDNYYKALKVLYPKN